ncbi:arachidonate 5-lipoxygenase-activating protein isoform X1 [Ursus maritimus]|uniref:Arachidonate 5-lipoxygenase-activating protein n=1 Tax=Ursus maritimus TaxID=29073 RepID=A0A8M1F7L5_URSMA|nr:arachidonate 5-lipoxygenase-activating protein isoform X1 [Ursus maritimus]
MDQEAVGNIVLLAIVTLISVVQNGFFAHKVEHESKTQNGRSFQRTGTLAFERVYTANQNCVDAYPTFLVVLWSAGLLCSQGTGAQVPEGQAVCPNLRIFESRFEPTVPLLLFRAAWVHEAHTVLCRRGSEHSRFPPLTPSALVPFSCPLRETGGKLERSRPAGTNQERLRPGQTVNNDSSVTFSSRCLCRTDVLAREAEVLRGLPRGEDSEHARLHIWETNHTVPVPHVPCWYIQLLPHLLFWK